MKKRAAERKVDVQTQRVTWLLMIPGDPRPQTKRPSSYLAGWNHVTGITAWTICEEDAVCFLSSGDATKTWNSLPLGATNGKAGMTVPRVIWVGAEKHLAPRKPAS